jgi:hypothetical protein
MMGVAAGAEIPQTLTLKDTRGRAIEIRPTSATDTEVAGIRSSDQKEVKIPLDTLDAESRKSVQGWKKLTGRLPKKQFVGKFTKEYAGREKYTVSFKVPEGLYNATYEPTSIKLLFDIPRPNNTALRGELYLKVFYFDLKKEAALANILRDFNSDIESALQRMTPSERQLKEPLMKLEKISHGKFAGYKKPLDHWLEISTTNGEFTVFISLKPANLPSGTECLVTPEDIPRILGTLEIVEGH